MRFNALVETERSPTPRIWTNPDKPTPTERAILRHMSTHHHIAIVSLDELSNVKIIKVIPDVKKLVIYEALMILHKKTELNRQIDNFVNNLKLFARGYHPAPPARQLG